MDKTAEEKLLKVITGQNLLIKAALSKVKALEDTVNSLEKRLEALETMATKARFF
jgi:ubiquinone biosynthesis protein UbiJ